ncbi:MAG TPA: hypothetical protein VEZ70_11235 [Allosphingosinicella sp.]|nr:hypothetical protein [Allosphingosinicella sp.]
MSNIKYGGSLSSAEWSARAFPHSAVHASSLAVTPLEVLDLDGHVHAHGTGFVYRIGGRPYFVTAWHVLTGTNFFSGQKNPTGLIPRQVRFFAPTFSQVDAKLNLGSVPFILDLKEKALEILANPPTVFGVPVDVAVGELPVHVEKAGLFTSKGLNEFEWGFAERAETPIHTMIGAEIFVLGYPLTTYEGLRTPIWKRGALASEPSFAIEPKCSFLLDVNTTGGMSGGPIIRRVTTMTAHNQDEGVVQEYYDEAVIGVYSGRALSPKEPSFVLGYGWPIDLVHEIVRTSQCFSGTG